MRLDILVVDDDPQSRYLVEVLLGARGHAVRGAPTLAGARAAIALAAPGVILLDVSLPDGDGAVFATELRTDPVLDATVIIGVSAHSTPDDRERMLAAGAAGYVEKPIEPETFAIAIEAIAKGARGEATCRES